MIPDTNTDPQNEMTSTRNGNDKSKYPLFLSLVETLWKVKSLNKRNNNAL